PPVSHWDRDHTVGGVRAPFTQRPLHRIADHRPCAAAFTSDIDYERTTSTNRHCNGNRIHRGCDYRRYKQRFRLTRTADSVADVLLVNPTLHVFTGHVEPHRGGLRPGPRYG